MTDINSLEPVDVRKLTTLELNEYIRKCRMRRAMPTRRTPTKATKQKIKRRIAETEKKNVTDTVKAMSAEDRKKLLDLLT